MLCNFYSKLWCLSWMIFEILKSDSKNVFNASIKYAYKCFNDIFWNFLMKRKVLYFTEACTFHYQITWLTTSSVASLNLKLVVYLCLASIYNAYTLYIMYIMIWPLYIITTITHYCFKSKYIVALIRQLVTLCQNL